MSSTIDSAMTQTLSQASVARDVLDLVGNTPVVDVSRLSPNPDVRILAKLEMNNPFGSVKDRIAKSMILAAEADGRLQPGQTILEPSSGNTGIALAAIARLRGYPIKILMPESVSVERRQMLQIMGAEVILTLARKARTERFDARRRWPPTIPIGASSTSTATRQTPARTTPRPVPKSGVMSLISLTSSPDWARRAP